jgi:hypothetical protein
MNGCETCGKPIPRKMKHCREHRPIVVELDPRKARAETDDAVTRAYEAAKEEWRQSALDAFCHVAKRNRFFNSDPVWVLLEERWEVPPPKTRSGKITRSGYGGVVQKAKVQGVALDTGSYMGSDRPWIHNSMMPIYQSLVYDGTIAEDEGYSEADLAWLTCKHIDTLIVERNGSMRFVTCTECTQRFVPLGKSL